MKTFYKKRADNKVFFSPGMKIKSYAFGKEIHAEFIDWRKRFLANWNSSTTDFLIFENGSIDGNAAKIDKVGELRVVEPGNKRTVRRKKDALTPLFIEGIRLEMSSGGELILNGESTDKYFGTELKAWGVSVSWKKNIPSYILFVFGKTEEGTTELRGYSLDIRDGVDTQPICSVPFDTTLSRKSHLYCFGKHIFLINDARLNYYYYNVSFSRLEEVAIETDMQNEGKPFLSKVASTMVCDSNGCVYWQSGNSVYSFPIGYPRRLSSIDLGERNELVGIQTFRDRLFVYRKSKITSEYSCLSYVRDAGGDDFEGALFNRGAKYNMFYSENSDMLHYVKVSATGIKGEVVRRRGDSETVISQVNLSDAEQMFCVNGNLYLNCSYVSAVQIKD